MSSPIFIICSHAKLPSVEAVNGRLASLSYSTRLSDLPDWEELGPIQKIALDSGQGHGKILFSCDWLSSVHARHSLQLRSYDQDFYDRHLRRYGDFAIETSWSWVSGENLAIAETMHALLAESGGVLWFLRSQSEYLDPADSVARAVELVNDYRRQDGAPELRAKLSKPRPQSSDARSSFSDFMKKTNAQN